VHTICRSQAGRGSEHQPWQHLLPATAWCRSRSRDHSGGLDRLHLGVPLRAASRMLRGLLAAEGCSIGRRHVKTLMQRNGIEASIAVHAPRRPSPGTRIYPYPAARNGKRKSPGAEPSLGRWTSRYIPDGGAASSIWLSCSIVFSRDRALSWRLSITMEAAFCIETLEDADGPSRQAGDLQHGPGLAVPPAPPSPEHSSTTALRSAWMARVLGGTMCSSSDCGAASSTRRSICGPTTASPTPVIRLAVIGLLQRAGAHTRA